MANSIAKTKRTPILFVLLGGLVLLVLFLIYILIASLRTLPTLPNVSILGELSGSQVSVGQQVIVLAIASDPDGIAKAEFWVNDVLIATQLNPDPGAESGFSASQTWRPNETGPYSVYVRAQDSQGFLGQSELVVMEVVSSVGGIPEDASQQMFAGEGDTLASLAETYGTTEEALNGLNPGLGGTLVGVGASVLVPLPVGGDGQEDEDNIPQVGRPAGGGRGAGRPAQAANPPGWTSALNPNWVNTICRAAPGLCGGLQSGQDVPPSAPTDVTAEVGETCQVRVSWTDTSQGETGFKVFRYPSETDNAFIAEFKPGEGSGSRFTYVDTVNAGEGWYYVVSSVNLGGETNSAPSDAISVECSLDVLPGDTLAIEIEALTMTLSGGAPAYGQLYCYLSLMDAAYERIPPSASQFFTREDSQVDIATYLSGENSRLLIVQRDEPVLIAAECLLLTNEGPQSLGSFSRSHSAEEWDGRELIASSDSGEYTVTYRIQGRSDQMQVLSQNFGLVDASIPPPYNLEVLYSGAQRLCRTTSAGVDCQIIDEGDNLYWDVEPEDLWPAEYGYDDIWGFAIYYQLPVMESPRLFQELSPVDYSSNQGTQNSDRLTLCRESITYYVSILVNTPAGLIESPLSEGYDYRPDCPLILELTMERVEFGDLKDGWFDDTVEVYGDFYILSPRDYIFILRWNDHPFVLSLPGKGVAYTGFTPYTTSLESNSSIKGESMYFSVLDFLGGPVGQWVPNRDQTQNNNRVYVVPRPGEDIELSGYLYDHDSGGLLGHNWADDELCWFEQILLSRTSEEWFTFDRTISIDGEGKDGSCTVTWRVRGVPRGIVP